MTMYCEHQFPAWAGQQHWLLQICDVLGGQWAEAETETLVGAILGELVDEVDALLSAGSRWVPQTGEIVHPVDVDLPGQDEMRALIGEAWQAVESRLPDIVDRTLATAAR